MKGSKRKPGLAHYVLKNIYRPLYDIEKEIKEKKLGLEETVAYRVEKSKPILDDWYVWLTTHQELTIKDTPIWNAIHYALKYWDGLLVYLNHGAVEIGRVEHWRGNFRDGESQFAGGFRHLLVPQSIP